MKILLSAYACHPAADSEARLGWEWAQQLAARGHQVWVLTRDVARPAIEAHHAEKACPDNLHFIFHDCRPLLPVLKLLRARFRYFYYYVWQWGAYKEACRWHARESFDLVHHATWVQYRAPSFMGRLGIPFVFGPVAGGESTPWRLRTVTGLRQVMIDFLRDAWSLMARVDPLVMRTYREATRINVTPGTLHSLPGWARQKAHQQLAIAYEPSTVTLLERSAATGRLRVLFVGRFLGWKGMSLGLNAFARALEANPEITLTMVGDGPESGAWRKQARSLNIEASVTWIEWLPHTEVGALYARHDVLLFPSLHDSGGLVVLEAMTHGMPVLCLALGGPGAIVDADSGIKVVAASQSRRAVESSLAEAIRRLATEPSLLARLSAGAKQRASEFNWSNLIANAYGDLVERIDSHPPTPCLAAS